MEICKQFSKRQINAQRKMKKQNILTTNDIKSWVRLQVAVIKKKFIHTQNPNLIQSLSA